MLGGVVLVWEMFKTIRKSLKIGGVQRKITDKSPAVLKEIAKAEKEKKTELDFSEKGIIDLPEVYILLFQFFKILIYLCTPFFITFIMFIWFVLLKRKNMKHKIIQNIKVQAWIKMINLMEIYSLFNLLQLFFFCFCFCLGYWCCKNSRLVEFIWK